MVFWYPPALEYCALPEEVHNVHCRQLRVGAVGILARHQAMARRGYEHTGNTAYQDPPAPAAAEEEEVGHLLGQGLARLPVEQP